MKGPMYPRGAKILRPPPAHTIRKDPASVPENFLPLVEEGDEVLNGDLSEPSSRGLPTKQLTNVVEIRT